MQKQSFEYVVALLQTLEDHISDHLSVVKLRHWSQEVSDEVEALQERTLQIKLAKEVLMSLNNKLPKKEYGT